MLDQKTKTVFTNKIFINYINDVLIISISFLKTLYLMCLPLNFLCLFLERLLELQKPSLNLLDIGLSPK